jgi:hypothetical protein
MREKLQKIPPLGGDENQRGETAPFVVPNFQSKFLNFFDRYCVFKSIRPNFKKCPMRR